MRLQRTKLSKKTKKTKKISLPLFQRINVLFAILLAAQAVALALLSDYAKGLKPVTTNFSTNDTLLSTTTKSQVYTSASHHLFDISLAIVLVVLLVAAALAHLWRASQARRSYEADLKAGVNKLRWIEYTVTGSLVVVATGLLVGINDYLTLLALIVLGALSALLLMLSETNRLQAPGVSRFCAALALLAGITPWIIIGLYIWGSISFGSGLRMFVYVAAATTAFLALLAGINTYLVLIKKNRWNDYNFAELCYLVLNFVLLTSLSWQIYAGLLRK